MSWLGSFVRGICLICCYPCVSLAIQYSYREASYRTIDKAVLGDIKAIRKILNYYSNDLAHVKKINGDEEDKIYMSYSDKEIREVYKILVNAIKNKKIKIIDEFLKYNINVCVKLDSGLTILELAMKQGCPEISQKFTNKCIAEKNHNSLHLAVSNGWIEFTEQLLAAGINIESVNEFNNTPFLLAVQNHQLKMIKKLADANANINAKDKNKNTGLMYAIKWGTTEIIEELIKLNVDIDGKTIELALELDDKKLTKLVILKALYGTKTIELSQQSKQDIAKLVLEEIFNGNLLDKYSKNPEELFDKLYKIYPIKEILIDLLKELLSDLNEILTMATYAVYNLSPELQKVELIVANKNTAPSILKYQLKQYTELDQQIANKWKEDPVKWVFCIVNDLKVLISSGKFKIEEILNVIVPLFPCIDQANLETYKPQELQESNLQILTAENSIDFKSIELVGCENS